MTTPNRGRAGKIQDGKRGAGKKVQNRPTPDAFKRKQMKTALRGRTRTVKISGRLPAPAFYDKIIKLRMEAT